MINSKTPILILLLILLFLLVKCNNNSETFFNYKLGTISSWGHASEPANIKELNNNEIIISAFKPTDNSIVRTNVYCGKCNQNGFDFNCKECAPHLPENLSKHYNRWIHAKEKIEQIDKKYTNGEISELEFHKQFREWFDKFKDLTLLPKNKIRQNEIINDCDIFDIDQEHKILVGDNEFKKYIPLKTIDKIIKYEIFNSKNSNLENTNSNLENINNYSKNNFSNIENI